MTAYHLAIAIALLQAADAATTLYFLKHTNLQEANPLLKRLFEKFGALPTLAALKGGFAVAIWYWHADIQIEALLLIVVIYGCVVWWNITQIKRNIH